MTELTEGVNTYSVIPIIMRDRNADSILEEFRQKIKCGEMLTRHELAILTLCPLMGGEMGQKERILSAFSILQNTKDEKIKEDMKLNNARNLLDILDEKMIAERIGLPLETVRKLKKEKDR